MGFWWLCSEYPGEKKKKLAGDLGDLGDSFLEGPVMANEYGSTAKALTIQQGIRKREEA
jgi:3-hydroxyisobutyrate dehydrogenase-like beta-hydroxyacid dehydrogenase